MSTSGVVIVLLKGEAPAGALSIRTSRSPKLKSRSSCYEHAKKGGMVDLTGFEPVTSSMPLKRAPNCATGPQLGSTLYL